MLLSITELINFTGLIKSSANLTIEKFVPGSILIPTKQKLDRKTGQFRTYMMELC